MTPLTVSLITALSGGGLGGLVLLFKVRPDRHSVMVSTIEHGVLVQERIIERLERELATMTARAEAAETELAQRRAKRRRDRTGPATGPPDMAGHEGV